MHLVRVWAGRDMGGKQRVVEEAEKKKKKATL